MFYLIIDLIESSEKKRKHQLATEPDSQLTSSSIRDFPSSEVEDEQLYSVTTHEKEFEYIHMTLNNEPVVVLIDKQESTVDRSKETEDYHPQQLSEDDQLQDSLDNQIPYSEDFDSPDEDSKNLDDETAAVQNPDNVLDKSYCHEVQVKSEELQKLEHRNCTVAAVRLSPVSIHAVKAVPQLERPPINKFKRDLKPTVPQIVHRQRPPRKPPDNNHNKQDGS